MSLVQFTSDRGRGYTNCSVYVESTEVAAISPNTDQYSRSDNRASITLKNGEVIWVTDQVEGAAKKIAAASA